MTRPDPAFAHTFAPGRIIDTMPPVEYCACGLPKNDPMHTPDEPAWKMIEPPDGPWILVLPEWPDFVDRHTYQAILGHFQPNPPLILFADNLDAVKFLDEAQMNNLGWGRI